MNDTPNKQNSTTKAIGNKAESIVAEYLQYLGYDIIDRNFSCKAGELDIIASQNGEIVFVEVRSRHSDESINPLFTITEKKHNSIKKAAQIYIMKNSLIQPFRFDFAIVTMNPSPTVELIENALFDLPIK
ncbi:MAG: YraN family protein [Desulfomonilaceae bacterium]